MLSEIVDGDHVLLICFVEGDFETSHLVGGVARLQSGTIRLYESSGTLVTALTPFDVEHNRFLAARLTEVADTAAFGPELTKLTSAATWCVMTVLAEHTDVPSQARAWPCPFFGVAVKAKREVLLQRRDEPADSLEEIDWGRRNDVGTESVFELEDETRATGTIVYFLLDPTYGDSAVQSFLDEVSRVELAQQRVGLATWEGDRNGTWAGLVLKTEATQREAEALAAWLASQRMVLEIELSTAPYPREKDDDGSARSRSEE